VRNNPQYFATIVNTGRFIAGTPGFFVESDCHLLEIIAKRNSDALAHWEPSGLLPI